MTPRKPIVQPLRRSSRLQIRAQKAVRAKSAVPVRRPITAKSVRSRAVAISKRAERLGCDETGVKLPARVNKATAIRTRIKGAQAQKRVNSRMSSCESFMSGTRMTIPKPRTQRTGHVHYRQESLPRPPYDRSSSSSYDSQPGVRYTESFHPHAGQFANPKPGSTMCSVCGELRSHTTSARDPRISSALNQAIINLGPGFDPKGRKTKR